MGGEKKKKYATVGQLKYQKTVTDNKLMLNARDTALLSVASLLGLVFSIIQIFKLSSDEVLRLLVFLPVVFFGWVMPVAKYIIRINYNFRKSLIEHFKSRIYVGFATVGYIVNLMVLFDLDVALIIVAGVISSLVVAGILRWQVSGFFKQFGQGVPTNFKIINLFLKGTLGIVLILFSLLTLIYFYLAILIFIHSPGLNLAPILVAIFVSLILTIILFIQVERT